MRGAGAMLGVLVVACGVALAASPDPPRPAGAVVEAAADGEGEAPATEEEAAEAGTEAGAYDLAADLADRAARARARFGPHTPVRLVGDVFLLVDAQGAGLLDDVEPKVKRALGAYFAGPFPKQPMRAVSVYLFADPRRFEKVAREDYGRHAENVFGFYAKEQRDILAANPDIGDTLLHEIAHPIEERYWEGSSGPPRWLDECVASQFESAVYAPDGSIHGTKNRRYPKLRAALDGPPADRPRLSAFFGMTNLTFAGIDLRNPEENVAVTEPRRSRNYAGARYVCLWLDVERHQLWDLMHAWRDRHPDDRTGESAFEEVLGQPPEAFDDAWVRWVKAL